MLLPPGEFVGAGRVEYNTACPFCDKDKKFYWNTEKEVGFCHSCEKTIVGERQFEKAFRDTLEEVYRKADAGCQYAVLPTLMPAWDNDRARKYLHGRGITLEQSIKRKIQYSAMVNCIYVPVHPLCEGYPRGWYRRIVSGESGGWRAQQGLEKNVYAYGHEWIPEERRTVIIVEGIFDVLSPQLEGYAIALFGIHMTRTQLLYLVDNFDTFYIWLDPGAPARRAVRTITEKLENYGKQVIDYVTDADPGDHGPRHPDVKSIKNKIDEIEEFRIQKLNIPPEDFEYCPICHDEYETEESKIQYEWQGKQHVCCPTCYIENVTVMQMGR